MKKISDLALPSTCIFFLFCGCYANRSVVDPWRYTPANPEVLWMKPSQIKPKELRLEAEIPATTDAMTLAEIIDIALKNNTQTRLSWAKARSAAASYAQTQSSDFPTIEFFYNYEHGRGTTFNQLGTLTSVATPSNTSTNSGNNPPTPTTAQGQGGTTEVATGIAKNFFSLWGPQLSLSYTIFDFGQMRASSEAARQALYFADFIHNRTLQTLIQTITTDYYDYAYQFELLEAKRADLQTAQTTLDAASLELQMGVKDISDFLQAKTQFLQAQIALSAQKQNVQNSYAALLKDMGLPANLELMMTSLPKKLPPETSIQTVDELLTTALQQRPDLLAQEADVRSKEEGLKAAKRLFYPTVQYNFDFGKTFFKKLGNDEYDFDSTISLNFPLFAGFFYKNGVKMARANKLQSEANLKDLQLTIYKDITTSHYNVKIAFDTLYFADDYLKSAEKQYTVSLSKYKVGTATILDVVSAQGSLADARASRASALERWYTSLATLAYAAGIFSNSLKQEVNQR
ncbi:MAG: TolC family protein [Anaerolineae bacterium]